MQYAESPHVDRVRLEEVSTQLEITFSEAEMSHLKRCSTCLDTFTQLVFDHIRDHYGIDPLVAEPSGEIKRFR